MYPTIKINSILKAHIILHSTVKKVRACELKSVTYLKSSPTCLRPNVSVPFHWERKAGVIYTSYDSKKRYAFNSTAENAAANSFLLAGVLPGADSEPSPPSISRLFIMDLIKSSMIRSFKGHGRVGANFHPSGMMSSIVRSMPSVFRPC